MRHEVSGLARRSGRGIWRASIPAIAAFACIRSLQRRPRPRLTRLRGRQLKTPAPFISWILCVLLFAHACALPVHLGLLFRHIAAPAMTEGCEKKTCCTALCYVDKYGIHHCVHKPGGDFCKCGLSTDDPDTYPIVPVTMATLPESECLFPSLMPSEWVFQTPTLIASYSPATPSPPPK